MRSAKTVSTVSIASEMDLAKGEEEERKEGRSKVGRIEETVLLRNVVTEAGKAEREVTEGGTRPRPPILIGS